MTRIENFLSNKGSEFYFLSILLVAVLFFAFPSAVNHEVHLVKDLEVWQPSNAVKFEDSWFDESCKVVVYMKHYRHLNRYTTYIEKYPEVPFLFYFGGRDVATFKSGVGKIGFNHPIIIDTNGEFYDENKSNMDDYSFISMVINGNSVQIANPTISYFERLLKECSQSNR